MGDLAIEFIFNEKVIARERFSGPFTKVESYIKSRCEEHYDGKIELHPDRVNVYLIMIEGMEV